MEKKFRKIKSTNPKEGEKGEIKKREKLKKENTWKSQSKTVGIIINVINGSKYK